MMFDAVFAILFVCMIPICILTALSIMDAIEYPGRMETWCRAWLDGFLAGEEYKQDEASADPLDPR